MLGLLSPLVNEVHRPWAGTGLAVVLLGTLEMIYALAPPWSARHRLLKVLFWALYPVLVLFFFTGRKMRKDPELHRVYAWLIVLLGWAILAWAFFR